MGRTRCIGRLPAGLDLLADSRRWRNRFKALPFDVDNLPRMSDSQPTARGAERSRARRIVVAGSAGNIVEWFDWTVYAMFATYFAQQFFPSADALASLMATFAVFAVGFFARPLGSVVLGRISDRRGRKAALTWSILIMAGATLAIALLPTYDRIGMWAPALLVLLRLVQGLSLGGETAAVGAFLVESAPDSRRGRFASVFPTTVMAGTVLGSLAGLLLNRLLTPAQMDDFGWRVPFAIGALLGLIGFLVRRGAPEPLDPAGGFEPRPVRRTVKEHPGSSGVVFAMVGAAGVAFFGLVAGFPSLAKIYGIPDDKAFSANVVGLIVLVLIIPLIAALSDRVGRRPMLVCGTLWMVVAAPVGLWQLVDHHALAAQLVVVPGVAAVQAVLMVSMIERFPTQLRGTGFGSVWAFAIALAGGTAPLISTALQSGGREWAFGWYVAAWALVAAVVAWRSRETAFTALDRG